MLTSLRKTEAIDSAIVSLLPVGPDNADSLRGIFDADAAVAEIRREFLERGDWQAHREPYPSQEFVANVNTGRGMDPETWRANQISDELLSEQTKSIAAALERTGVVVRGADNVTAISLVTCVAEKLDSYRAICMFPTVAQRTRRPMLNELRFFRGQNRHQRKFMRYAVVTSGLPVPVPDHWEPPPIDLSADLKTGAGFEMRDRARLLSKMAHKFSKWALDKFDIDVVFRGTEYTIKRRGSDAFRSVHVHMNMLYTPNRKLTKREWDVFLKGAASQFEGCHWKDCGKLENPREAIKYQFKPMELRGLTDSQYRWIHEQTFGVKMSQPMGSFYNWRCDNLWINEKRADGSVRRRKHRKVVTIEYRSGARLGMCSVRRRPGRTSDGPVMVNDTAPAPENVLMGITMPQRRYSPYAEPCALVMGYTPHPNTELGKEALATIVREGDQARKIWDMNGAPAPLIALALGRGQAAAREGEAGKIRPFRVHTRSPSAERLSLYGGVRAPPDVFNSSADPGWGEMSGAFQAP